MEINLNETEIEFLSSEDYKITSAELKMIMGKHGARNQLLFAVLLQYYKIKNQFPDTHNGLVSYLSKIMADEIKTKTCYFHESNLILPRFSGHDLLTFNKRIQTQTEFCSQ